MRFVLPIILFKNIFITTISNKLISDSNKISGYAEALQQQKNSENEQQNGYLQLLQQREEENRQEVAKLTAEIRLLKLQLLQLKSKYLHINNCLVCYFVCI